MPDLRAIAIAVIRRPRDGALLVLDGRDPATGERFFRPLGGGIEFGERAAQTVVRELREEIGADITYVVQIGLIENLFTLDAKPHHELVVVFEAALVDESLFEREVIDIDENGQVGRALWVRIEDCRSPERPDAPAMYPDASSSSSRGDRTSLPVGGIQPPWIASSCSMCSIGSVRAR